MPKNTKKSQKQKQKQLMAHDRLLIFDTFYNMIEALEEYVEKSGSYPNFVNKRQVYKKTVPQGANLTINKAESLFKTQLLIFVGMLENDAPEFLREEIKEVYYKWISKVGINANNCSDERLKHFLIEINNSLDGNGERIIDQTKEYLENKEKNKSVDLWQWLNVFNYIQNPLDKNREQAKLLENKSWNEVKIENKFNSSAEQGEQTYNQISRMVSSSHDNFHFYPQQLSSSGDSVILSGSSSFPNELEKIVQDLKINPQDWTLDEITTQLSDYYRERKVEKWLIIHRGARLGADAYDNEGRLKFVNNPIYLWENFNAYQRFEMKRALKLSGDYSTNDEINWVVKEVKDSPSIWQIGTFKGYDCLIHGLAQGNDDEVGTLIHYRQRFNDVGWGIIRNSIILERVKQEKDFWITDTVDNNEALINKSAIIDEKTIDANGEFYDKAQFSDEEWDEIQNALNNERKTNYDNWTKEQLIAEINRLNTLIEQFSGDKTLTSSERQEKVQESRWKLEQVQNAFSSKTQQPKNSFFIPLLIGAVVLVLASLGIYGIVKKFKKIKKSR